MDSSSVEPLLTQRRILIVNPNSNPSVTARVQATADQALGTNCTALAVHPSLSPHAIESPADRLIAEPLALELLRQRQDFEGYVIACFDDLGIKQARDFLNAPVVDCVEASLALARLYTNRFSIVTTVETMVPGIRNLVQRHGADGQCTIRAANIGVAAAAAGEPEAMQRLDDAIRNARDGDGAGAIILGSGGLAGLSARLSEQHGLPVIDCIEAAVLMAEMASRCLLNARPKEDIANPKPRPMSSSV